MTQDKSARPVSTGAFSTCARGHRTVNREDYIYDSTGRRGCRACAVEDKQGKAKPRKKVF
jgi:hypothetical protein